MRNIIELIPDACNIIESQRSIGYNFYTAVADIIDNSISANVRNVYLYFNSDLPYLSIIDDGGGMDNEELLLAMKYGSKSIYERRNENDLGRFGLGLKMASFSQCRLLTLVSKKNNNIYGYVWDLDLIKKENKWNVMQLSNEDIDNIKDIDKLKQLESGTMVQWENFDKLKKHANVEDNFDEEIAKIEYHLSLVFHRYLQNNRLNIIFNDHPIEYIDPLFTKNTNTQIKEEDVIYIKELNAQIKIRPYITPYYKKIKMDEIKIIKKFIDNPLDQGLYIYRNERLITWGKWFRLFKKEELGDLAKIQIDIPNNMDDLWQIDIKKSTLSIPPSLKDDLIRIIEKSIDVSKRVYKHKGLKRNNDNLQHIFDRIERDNKVSYRINTSNPILDKLYNELSKDNILLLNSLIRQIENNLPIESIRYDMSNHKDIDNLIRDSNEENEIYEQVIILLRNQTTKNSKLKFLELLKNNEAYSNYKDILDKIGSELHD